MVPDYSYSRPSRIFETKPWWTQTADSPGNSSGFDGDKPFCFVWEAEKDNKNKHFAKRLRTSTRPTEPSEQALL
jgi:hypothetical protein